MLSLKFEQLCTKALWLIAPTKVSEIEILYHNCRFKLNDKALSILRYFLLIIATRAKKESAAHKKEWRRKKSLCSGEDQDRVRNCDQEKRFASVSHPVAAGTFRLCSCCIILLVSPKPRITELVSQLIAKYFALRLVGLTKAGSDDSSQRKPEWLNAKRVSQFNLRSWNTNELDPLARAKRPQIVSSPNYVGDKRTLGRCVRRLASFYEPINKLLMR